MVLCTQWIWPRSIFCRPDQRVKWRWWCGIIELQCSVVIVHFIFYKSSQTTPHSSPLRMRYWVSYVCSHPLIHIQTPDTAMMMLYWNMLKQHPDIYHIHTSMVEANIHKFHYSDMIMSMMASQITSVSLDNLGADQRKHQSSTLLALVRGIHWWPVNSPRKGPVAWKMFPFVWAYSGSGVMNMVIMD